MQQFNAGEVVTCIPDMFLRHAAPGAYKILLGCPIETAIACTGSKVHLKSMSVS